MAADELPFGNACLPVEDLGLVIDGFLNDRKPGLIAWRDLRDRSGPEPALLPVWVRGVGAV